MDPTRATDPANYSVILNGHAVSIAKAGYDPSANHAVLFLGATVPFGAFAQLFDQGAGRYQSWQPLRRLARHRPLELGFCLLGPDRRRAPG